jgi:hypothetical protein
MTKEIAQSQLNDARKHLEYSEWTFLNGYQSGHSYELSSNYWKQKIEHLEEVLKSYE